MTKLAEKTEYKKGYKKTKIGWIPDDWEVVKAKTFSEIVTGGTPTKNKSEYWENGTINWMSSGEVNKRYIYEVENKITEEGLKSSNTKIIPKNTIMIALNGQGKTRGTAAVLKVESTCNQSLAGFICDNNKIHYLFLFFYLQKSYDDIRNLTGDAGRTGLNLNILKNILVILPSISEQQKIAKILKCWDEKIEILEKLIEKKQLYKKALMQKLLSGKFRLQKFKISTWKHKKLSQVFNRVNRKNTENNHNILTISAQLGLISQEEFYNKRVASIDTSKYILLNFGEYAYNKSYSKGYPMGAIKRLDLYEKGVVSNLYICFSLADSNNSNDFFNHYFEMGLLNKEIQMIAQEGARNHGLLNITSDDFFNTLLFVPTNKEEQQEIANILNTCDEEIKLLNFKLEKLKQQKKGLMQKLLTGQVRVKTT